jgi:hypothetical protein
MVRNDLGLSIGVVNPNTAPKSITPKVLTDAATFTRRLRSNSLANSQFPDQLRDAIGTITKPGAGEFGLTCHLRRPRRGADRVTTLLLPDGFQSPYYVPNLRLFRLAAFTPDLVVNKKTHIVFLDGNGFNLPAASPTHSYYGNLVNRHDVSSCREVS